MSMFGNQANPQEEFAKAVKTVESVLGGFGLDPGRARLHTTDGSTAWTATRGSAEVLIFLNPAQNNGPNFMRCVSPIWRLPAGSADQLNAVLRKLLELNGRDLFGCAFGLMKDDVVLVSERVCKDMDRAEVEDILRNIGAAADHYDDWLTAQFGGVRLADLRKAAAPAG